MRIVNELKVSQSKDFVLVAMAEPQEVGRRFNEWPLHITLVPWFTAPDLSSVTNICRQAAAHATPFSVKVLDREYFGAHRLPVMIIEKHPKLVQLHNDLLDMITNAGWDVPGRYTRSQYKPHVTRHHGKDASGSVAIDAIYIVEKLEQGYRKVVGKVTFDE